MSRLRRSLHSIFLIVVCSGAIHASEFGEIQRGEVAV